MKKNVVRGLALLLVLLMCLSLIPLATAHAEGHVCTFEPTVIQPKCGLEGYEQMICPVCGNGGPILRIIEPTGNHLFESIEKEEYLIEDSDDPCVKPIIYWKSCVNYLDDQGTVVCGVSAEEAYNKAVENLQNELNQRKNSGENADWEKIIKDAIVAFDDQYKFTRGGLGHTWVEQEKQEPTCTSDGWTAYRQCSVCGALDGYEVVPAKGHRWGEITRIKDPTCTEPGLEHHICEVCDLDETGEIPALGHSFGDYTVTKAATCTEDGERQHTCAVCGYVETEVIPCGHKYGEFTVTKEPTCTEEGVQERECSVCGEKEQESIPAAHRYGEFVVTMEPTCYSTGERRSTCELCGDEIVEWIDMAHKYENGECVFCHEPEPEKPAEEASVTEEAGLIEEAETAADATEKKEASEGEAKDAETKDAEAGESEVLSMSDSEVFTGDKNVIVKLYANDGKDEILGQIEGKDGTVYEEYGGILPKYDHEYTGYNFTGWNTEPDGSGTSYGDVDDPYGKKHPYVYTFRNGETALYAQWAPIITIKFNANGGTPVSGDAPVSIPDITGSKGATKKLYTDKEPEFELKRKLDDGREYRFTGWNYKKEGTKYDEDSHLNSGTSVILNADVTVYAEWEKPVTIKYMSNGGSGYIDPDTTHFVSDTVEIASIKDETDKDILTRDGYIFTGWNTDMEGNGIPYEEKEQVFLLGDLTLYAQWARNVEVTFYGNGGVIKEEGMDDLAEDHQIVPSETYTPLSKNRFQKEKSRFTGWNTSSKGDGTSYTDGQIVYLDKKLELYAQWEQSEFDVEFYNEDETILIYSQKVSKGDVIELIDYDMTGDGKVLIGWSVAKGRKVASYTVGQGYTPTEDTKFYAVSGDAVNIIYMVNGAECFILDETEEGNEWKRHFAARSVSTELVAFENLYKKDDLNPVEPPATKYFKQWKDQKGVVYKDRQSVSLSGIKNETKGYYEVILTADWSEETSQGKPAEPSQVVVSQHLVNYNDDLLYGHSGKLSGLDTTMEYYTGNGSWDTFTSSTLGVKRPYNFEIRYKEDTSTKTPPSRSVVLPMYSFVSEASAPEEKSILPEEYSYNVNIKSVRTSGAKTIVKPNSEEWEALEDVLTVEDIYFLLDYPEGVTQNSNTLTLMHDGKKVEIEQLSEGILGKSKSFTNTTSAETPFTLTVDDKLYGLVELSDKAPKAGDTITATVSYTNLVGKPVYRWLRDGIPCTEYSNSNSYTLTGADLMHRLSCEVKSANTPPTPDGTIVSEQTSQVIIESHEAYVSESSTTSTFVGYFEGVTEDMEYSINDGMSFRSVTDMGALFDRDNHILYVTTPGVYIFRYRNETDPEYWEAIDNEIEGWYIVGYNVSTSSTDSGSGTVTFRNGTTTLSSSTRITDSSGNVIIQGEGTNRWRVRMGSNTNINMVVRPSGSSSSSSSSSNNSNTTYAHVSLNGGGYVSFSGERTITVEPVNQNKIYTVVFNKSSSSPRTADMSNLGLWSTVCFVSFVGAVSVFGSMRRRKKSED